MSKLPVRIQNVCSLTNLGIDPQYLKLGVTSFESDRCISINDKSQNGQNQLTQIQIDNNFSINRKPNKAETSLMHPTQNIIVLKASNGPACYVQIWNLDNKQKLKHIDLNEQIQYMTWVNATNLAIVTPTVVYHSDLNSSETHTKILDRYAELANGNGQIIGYKLAPQANWSTLYGISSPDGKTINGHIQLFKIGEGKQQILNGHCCCFGQAKIHNDTHLSTLLCFFEKKPGENTARIIVNEISVPPDGFQKHKLSTEYVFNPQFPQDFPIYMQVSTKYGQLFVVTKNSFLQIYELTTNILFYSNRIVDSPIFIGQQDSKEDGAYTISKNGTVSLIQIEAQNLVNYLIQNCQHIPNVVQLAFKLAGRYRLPGADDMFLDQFNKFMLAGDYAKAAQIAAIAPGESIRNSQTINKFKSLQGTPSPLLVYFQSLLQKGGLNQLESIELCTLVLNQGRKQFIESWIKENKLECSEQLGDLVGQYDQNLALDIYKKANLPAKVVQTLMTLGKQDEANQFAQQSGVNLDYMGMIKSSVFTNPVNAVQLAKTLVAQNPQTNIHAIAEIFVQAQKFKELSALLVDCMKQNRPEDGPWQTKILEWNIVNEPNIVETIFQLTKWNQYNKLRIAQLCEQKQLFQKALENYSDIKDIKRVCLNTQFIPHPYLINFFSNLQPEWALVCLQDMLRHNRQNLQLVVDIMVKNHQRFNVQACVKTFESVSSFDGIYLFLSQIISNTEDKDIHFKYIEAATKCNQLRTVEQVIQEKHNCYDPEKVKDFLKSMRLPDPKPIIFLCDIHKYIEELTQYLYKNNFFNYIQIYLFQVNPQATPTVLGSLIDQECEERQIQVLLQQIGGKLNPQCYDQLIEEFEKRNKLKVLEGWLEGRISEGSQIPSIHNALAKIKIDTNQDPESFLTNNQFYNAITIGKFCEERDPHLAVIAYKRSWGECDDQLIQVTNKNALFRIQAKYLVERQSPELWAKVLSEENANRQQVIEPVVTNALPESKEVDQVSCAVKAFMDANLPEYLITLLEKIVLHNHEFGQYKKLQNLLIITAIKSDQQKVMDYINRLDNYDGPEIAKIALNEQYGLYEEAFVIYNKNNMQGQAMDVILENIKDLQRAADYAQKINTNEVWSKLGNAYLDKNQIVECIQCYIKAKDPQMYLQVINVAENEGQFDQLVKYLLMCREQQVKDSSIDNSLAFCYAKIDRMGDLENFLSSANSVDVQRVGERCFEIGLYEAAKNLFTLNKNNAKIASCLIKLKQFQQAIEIAKKANTPKTWKELTLACVENSEFKLAAVSAMNIIIHPDHLEELIHFYEEFGHPHEMISVLETGMGLERAHVGIFTDLGVLYAKYVPQKLMEYCKGYHSKINIAKLLRICERYQHWAECTYLHQNFQQYDQAINIMIEHSPSAYSHDMFVNLLIKASNYDLYYKSIIFYLDEQPELLNDLLKSLTTKIDLTKCVRVMSKTGYLALITPFLKSVQNANNKEVNECLNDIHLENQDYESLHQSISTYENFDQLALAKATENHSLLEFRRQSAYLYRRIQKYEFSIALSKKDGIYRDAIETALESQKPELVEDLLRFFIQQNQKEFITITLYTCYDLVMPAMVLELAWRFNLFEYVMPYIIQSTHELTSRQKKHEKKEKEEEKKAAQAHNQNNQTLFIPGPEIIPAHLMLPPMIPPQVPGMIPSQIPGMIPSQIPGMMGSVPGMMMGGGVPPGFNTNQF